MPNDTITFQNSGYFSKLMVDYLNQKSTLEPLYNRAASLENFHAQILEKQENYSSKNRDQLFSALQKQYSTVSCGLKTQENINLLQHENTFTITTGHQLNLFTGPLYFLYKIISVINLCTTLKKKYPQYNFVPVYWMATEDHDFDEINHFFFQDKKINWQRSSTGPVGRLSTEGLDKVLEVFSGHLPLGDNAKKIKDLFQDAYLNHENLAQATRYLANELFTDQGLVIVDGDDAELKQLFAPYVERELLEQTTKSQVETTFAILKDYQIQVNPRDINLFYILDDLRERIILQDGVYHVNNTDIVFTKEQLLEHLKTHPQNFSPNAIMRPLYQEVILPNLCYIGGGGELAYWLELKPVFDLNKVTFPILCLRNSALIASKKQVEKLDRLNLEWKDIFLKQEALINLKAKEYSNVDFNFESQKQLLEKQFQDLLLLCDKTDKSFKGAVLAQEKKQLKGLDNLQKRLLKADKKSQKDKLQRIASIQTELFPSGSLQERNSNFSSFYIQYGPNLVQELIKKLDPLDHNFDLIIL
ncbi:bacillithiol biosynthesis cysteine-adding enzyme BshC [Myroides sp. LJL115]